jgi:hypothetical protein
MLLASVLPVLDHSVTTARWELCYLFGENTTVHDAHFKELESWDHGICFQQFYFWSPRKYYMPFTVYRCVLCSLAREHEHTTSCYNIQYTAFHILTYFFGCLLLRSMLAREREHTT